MTQCVSHLIQNTWNRCNRILVLIKSKRLAITKKALVQLELTVLNRWVNYLIDLQREIDFDFNEFNRFIERNLPKLVADTNFLDSPGGTDKTFRNYLILAKIRSQKIQLWLLHHLESQKLFGNAKSAIKLPLNMYIHNWRAILEMHM